MSKTVGSKPSPALARALETLARTALDNVTRNGGRGMWNTWYWNPQPVRPATIEVEALLPSAPADVVARLTELVAFISNQTTYHMAHLAPSSVLHHAITIQWALDDWAGRTRRKATRPKICREEP